MTDRHGIGGNNPPRPIAFAAALEDVRLEAGNWLDGAAVENQQQADAIGVILSRARQIKKDADAARKEDKEPHLAAGRAVDASYKPVIDQADTIMQAAQKPLTAWLVAEQERQRREAAEARQREQEAQQRALEAQRAADSLEALEAAQALQREADASSKLANRADKAKANAAGEGRAVGLRSYQVAVITDRRALLNHVAKEDPEALTAWLQEYARKALPRALPGVTIETERRAA